MQLLCRPHLISFPLEPIIVLNILYCPFLLSTLLLMLCYISIILLFDIISTYTRTYIHSHLKMPPFSLDFWDHESCQSVSFVNGPIIVGAGPSGLALAACLQSRGVPSVILERFDCIASLWRHKTYDRIHLHLPKAFCELPMFPVPTRYSIYMSGQQFLEYLEKYSEHFNIRPKFNEKVIRAKFDEATKLWRVSVRKKTKEAIYEVREYTGPWLAVASGENADAVMPNVVGLQSFKGSICHSCSYKNGSAYQGRKVLVVGCGNSAMEIALDLVQHKARPSLVVRNSVHVLPHEILGESTFSLIVKLSKLFPIWFADSVLLFCAWCKWRNTAKCGLPRPKEGPITHKNRVRRTPVLDTGTLRFIKNGEIKVLPGIERITSMGARFVNGESEEFDAIILATGYKSNIKEWLVADEELFTPQGLLRSFNMEDEWKIRDGLYAIGFSGKGLFGASMQAQLIAHDVKLKYSLQNILHASVNEATRDRLQESGI